jgi:hypothetical protein
MSRTFTASDRSALIRLAASLPKGDTGRRAILAALNYNTPLVGEEFPGGLIPAKDRTYYVVTRSGASMNGKPLQVGDVIESYAKVLAGWPLFRGYGFNLVDDTSSTKPFDWDSNHPAKSHFKQISLREARSLFEQGLIPSASGSSSAPAKSLKEVILGKRGDFRKYHGTSVYTYKYKNTAGAGSGFSDLKIEQYHSWKNGNAWRVYFDDKEYYLDQKSKRLKKGWDYERGYAHPGDYDRAYNDKMWEVLLDILWKREFKDPGFNVTR